MTQAALSRAFFGGHGLDKINVAEQDLLAQVNSIAV